MKPNLYKDHGIKYCAALPLSECKIEKPRLLARAGIGDGGSVLLMLLPYYCGEAAGGSVSMYAAARDYHIYFAGLSSSLVPELCSAAPAHVFAGMADSSPISELSAAAKAGLGIIGRHGLLINSEYSSFCFIGGIYSDIEYTAWDSLIENVHIPSSFEIVRCRDCGACAGACPAGCLSFPGGEYSGGRGECLSALTQKKLLTQEEETRVAAHPYVWGCDICQLCCPYTAEAVKSGTIETPIPFFRRDIVSELNIETLEKQLATGEFQRRAYSWRGPGPIERNVKMKEAASRLREAEDKNKVEDKVEDKDKNEGDR